MPFDSEPAMAHPIEADYGIGLFQGRKTYRKNSGLRGAAMGLSRSRSRRAAMRRDNHQPAVPTWHPIRVELSRLDERLDRLAMDLPEPFQDAAGAILRCETVGRTERSHTGAVLDETIGPAEAHHRD